MQIVRQGEKIPLPNRTAPGYVTVPAPDDGIYFKPFGVENGYFVDARTLWGKLDELID